MSRITNKLFEAIQRVSSGEQNSSVQEGSVDKAHFCATHVEHAFLGYGECISEDHAEPDENGDIAWYKVQFPTGIQRVNSDQLRIVEGKSHMHSKKMAEESIEEKKMDPVGKETADIDNDGDTDKSDSYLHNRRKAIGKAIRKEEAEPIEELSKNTLGSYVKKAVKDSKMAGKEETYAKYVSKNPKHAEESKRQSKNRSAGVSKAVDRLTKEDTSMMRTGNVPKKSKNPGTAAFNWKGQKPESKFEKKQTATGTVYTRKQNKDTNEGKTLTIINHNNFVLEVTDNPTFKDYFDALQMIAPTNDENIQKEMVTIATEAFNEGYTEIIAEAMMKTAYLDTVASYTKQGYKLVDESYTVADDEVYAEYMMEKDGSYYQYIYTGDIVPEEKE